MKGNDKDRGFRYYLSIILSLISTVVTVAVFVFRGSFAAFVKRACNRSGELRREGVTGEDGLQGSEQRAALLAHRR